MIQKMLNHCLNHYHQRNQTSYKLTQMAVGLLAVGALTATSGCQLIKATGEHTVKPAKVISKHAVKVVYIDDINDDADIAGLSAQKVEANPSRLDAKSKNPKSDELLIRAPVIKPIKLPEPNFDIKMPDIFVANISTNVAKTNPKPDTLQIATPDATTIQADTMNFGFSQNATKASLEYSLDDFYQHYQLTPARFAQKPIFANQEIIDGFLVFKTSKILPNHIVSYYDDSSDLFSGTGLLMIKRIDTNELLSLDVSNYTHSAYLQNTVKKVSSGKTGANKAFSAFASAYRVKDVHIKDDVLYFSYGHDTYSADSDGKNGYIAAIDVHDFNAPEPLWNSPALVSNAQNFVIDGGYIISGYGFTKEPDYLYMLDKATGTPIARHKLKTAPKAIVLKDNQLFVKTYNTDYVFVRQ